MNANHQYGSEQGMLEAVRIGAVNYLNTKPLICDLAELAPEAQLILEPPSVLADMLAAGRLDVALIPAIEYFRAGSYSVIPNIAIASRGPVLSVTLFSRVPCPAIRRLALDVGSRTAPLSRRSCCETAIKRNRFCSRSPGTKSPMIWTWMPCS